MERRRESRTAFNQPVWITALGEVETRLPGTAVNLSGSGMRLTVGQRLARDTPVKVETPDAIYLAEVCYCMPHNGAFVIGLAVDQVLTGLPDLARLRRLLTEDGARAAPAEALQPVQVGTRKP